MKNTFVLGAGFSVEHQFPLMYGLKKRVIHFLEAERHSAYATFLKPGNAGLPKGQFYSGLEEVDTQNKLELEDGVI
jgi:hypothetical protein